MEVVNDKQESKTRKFMKGLLTTFIATWIVFGAEIIMDLYVNNVLHYDMGSESNVSVSRIFELTAALINLVLITYFIFKSKYHVLGAISGLVVFGVTVVFALIGFYFFIPLLIVLLLTALVIYIFVKIVK